MRLDTSLTCFHHRNATLGIDSAESTRELQLEQLVANELPVEVYSERSTRDTLEFLIQFEVISGLKKLSS